MTDDAAMEALLVRFQKAHAEATILGRAVGAIKAHGLLPPEAWLALAEAIRAGMHNAGTMPPAAPEVTEYAESVLDRLGSGQRYP